MKVGTDGVLIGAWVDVQNKRKALDIGTGSGLIALMLAQKMHEEAKVHAIDIAPEAIEQAGQNFLLSGWHHKTQLHLASIQDFARDSRDKFDLIISNPPFFNGGMLSPHDDKNEARHTIKLPHGDLLVAVNKLLAEDGSLAIILPYLQGLRFIEISESYRLYPSRITEVKSTPGKPVERIMIHFERTPNILLTDELIIQDEHQLFTDQYKELTSDFYLKF